VGTPCSACAAKDAEIRKLREQNDELRLVVRELDKLCTLQAGDLERVKKEREKLEPNRSERIPGDVLQLAFEQFIVGVEQGAANDGGDKPMGASPAPPAAAESPLNPPPPPPVKKPGNKGHGRRDLDTTKLPVEEVVVKPADVLADPDKYRVVGRECSERLGYRKATYIRIRLIRPKFALIEEAAAADLTESCGAAEPKAPQILCAEIPGYFWPRVMADVSAITQVILSKYDMCLPLHRQERASPRCGLHLPRSTQCDWISAAYDRTFRIVDAMMTEGCERSFCIATDATGAPVRMPGACVNWHVFVFIADADHIVFRPTREHSSAAIVELLGGFKGRLLSDAALIYDTLHRDHGVVEVCCWAHMRRYIWRSRATEPVLALEALAIIAKLFEVARATNHITMPERTEERARRARPLLELLDRWVLRAEARAHDKSPLRAALTYYENQRVGLRSFLSDGRLRLDNNISEQQLRHLVLGRHNWNFFENAAGLNWYCVFRSLIASCNLHGLEAQDYLNEILRLAPHWPTTRMLELSPKYWKSTRARLSSEHRAIIEPPWVVSSESAPPTTTSTPSRAVA